MYVFIIAWKSSLLIVVLFVILLMSLGMFMLFEIFELELKSGFSLNQVEFCESWLLKSGGVCCDEDEV